MTQDNARLILNRVAYAAEHLRRATNAAAKGDWMQVDVEMIAVRDWTRAVQDLIRNPDR